MSLIAICQQETCFQNVWGIELRLAAMIRKFGFLELNKYLKEHNIINRYKRNVELKEVFDSGYCKTASSMVRDLIEHLFTGVDLEEINLEKQRGYATYNFDMRMPVNQTAFQTMLTDLEALREDHFLSWSTWNVRTGQKCHFSIHFGNMPIMVKYAQETKISLATFIERTRALAMKVRECHPAPIPVDPNTLQQVVAEVVTNVVVPPPIVAGRTTPIILRRID